MMITERNLWDDMQKCFGRQMCFSCSNYVRRENTHIEAKQIVINQTSSYSTHSTPSSIRYKVSYVTRLP